MKHALKEPLVTTKNLMKVVFNSLRKSDKISQNAKTGNIRWKVHDEDSGHIHQAR